MNKTSVILSTIMTVAFVLMLAPAVIAMNRGKLLRNTAMWVAIFTGLGLIYQNFGPDSPHPLFSTSSDVVQQTPKDAGTDKNKTDKTDEDKTDGSRGFTPPGE